MTFSVREETFDSLSGYWKNPSGNNLDWNSIFILPAWLKTWKNTLGTETKPYIASVREGDVLLGFAPLSISEHTASFMGSINVCDYQDFIISPGREIDFFNTLIDDLRNKGINRLELGLVRPDSKVTNHLVPLAINKGYGVDVNKEDVSLEMPLPASWDEYLESLDGKQRHEVRRKLRKLTQAGNAEFKFISDVPTVTQTMDSFLKMFTESRTDKADFLTPVMESYFRMLVNSMAKEGLMKFGLLTLEGVTVAIVLCFDYNGCIYLYNNGYESKYEYLSAGLICKVLAIKESIESGKKRFDFLKGNETYKYQLGGREIELSRCRIEFK